MKRVDSGTRDRLRAYKVLIDDLDVGELKRGESARFVLHPGAHSLQVAVDWKRSASFDVSGDRENEYVFRCGPRSGGLIADLLKRRDDTWLFLEPDNDEGTVP